MTSARSYDERRQPATEARLNATGPRADKAPTSYDVTRHAGGPGGPGGQSHDDAGIGERGQQQTCDGM